MRAETPVGMSLQHSLLRWLLPLVLLMLLFGAISDYEVAVGPMQQMYDQTLYEGALVVRDRIERFENDPGMELSVHLSHGSLTLLSANHSDKVFISVYDHQHRCLAGSCWLKPFWQRWHPEQVQYQDLMYGNESVRLASYHFQMRGQDLSVQVGTTTHHRDQTERRILIGMIVPELLGIISVVAVLLIGVRRGLMPLEHVRQLADDLPGTNISRLPEQQMPSELSELAALHNRQADRLQGSLNMQDTFVTNAAHQLRTPLAGLRVQADVAMRLMAREPVSPELRNSIENIQRAAMRAVRLVQQMLGLARSQTSVEDFVTCNLRSVAEHGVARLVALPASAQVDVGLELEDASVNGVEMLLDELLANLLDNACKYCPAGSRVTVRTRVTPDAVELEVEDDGPGIPPEERERVFERFYRRDQQVDGVGLGLAIVREIADLHQARVVLGSGGDGKGLRVTLRFPVPGLPSSPLLPDV